MESDPPDARREWLSRWVIFCRMLMFVAGDLRATVDIAAIVRSSAKSIPLFFFISPLIGCRISQAWTLDASRALLIASMINNQ